MFNYLTSNGDSLATDPTGILALLNYDIFDFYHLLEVQESKLERLRK